MSKSSNEEKSNTLKRSWFQELKGEFRKITWLDKNSLARQSVAVVISSVVLGCIIAIVDWLIQVGLNFIVG
ncbi:MAG: preprotein translocase subunit SecE [Clostridiales bacterium]|nr:preprotein translocase subunit SecE [Clostridiales bacterium]